MDLGSLVGLRGCYGRGVETDDPSNFQNIQMVGGLGRFRLGTGSGFVPYLTLGGGYLDVLDGYESDVAGTNSGQPDDRPFALGGIGVEIPVGNRFRLAGEARAMALSNQDEQDVSQPDDIILNPYYRAGLSLASAAAPDAGLTSSPPQTPRPSSRRSARGSKPRRPSARLSSTLRSSAPAPRVTPRPCPGSRPRRLSSVPRPRWSAPRSKPRP